MCVVCYVPFLYSFAAGFAGVFSYIIPKPYSLWLLSYLIGAIPVSVVLSKIIKMPDPRSCGSCNVGVSNVLRTTGSKKTALLVAFFEMSKGVLACYFAGYIGGAMAILGQIYPVTLRFKGGKGLSVLLGCMIYTQCWAVFLIPVWFIISKRWYPSVAAIVMIAIYSGMSLWNLNMLYMLPAVALILFRHKDNFVRLLKGEENKL